MIKEKFENRRARVRIEQDEASLEFSVIFFDKRNEGKPDGAEIKLFPGHEANEAMQFFEDCVNKARLITERRVYIFVCDNCGHKRQSFKRARARKKTCRSCGVLGRKAMIAKNQTSLFPMQAANIGS